MTTTNLLQDPAVGALVINARDVTDRHLAEEGLRLSAAQQAALAELGRLAVGAAGIEEVVVRAVGLIGGVLGVDGTAFRRHGQGDGPAAGEARRSDGGAAATPVVDPVPGQDAMVVPVADAQGVYGHLHVPATGRVALIEDERAFLHSVADVLAGAIARRSAYEELRRRSLEDALTGLPNRLLLVDRLEESLERLGRSPGSVSVMFIDTDDFKVINDSLGHAMGDRVVKSVGRRLQHGVRAGDTVARFGGDEFVVLCDDTGVEEASLLAERLLVEVSQPLEVDGRIVVVTASIGVATTDDGRTTVAELLSNADAAMYVAKASGKRRYAVFDRSMRTNVTARLELTSDLRHALSDQSLVVHYQPVIEAATGAVSGAEALVRWLHPQRGLLAPGAFIGVAEDSGLILRLGAQVLEAALAQACTWGKNGYPAQISVNLSPRQLASADILATVGAAIENSGIDPRQVSLEVTENAVIEDLDLAASRLADLRSIGCSIGMDDFGTGYSSLALLARLPVDFIKIDRSFLPTSESSSKVSLLLEAILRLCATLGLATVAEGVETEAQRTLLTDLGVDYLQGYLLGRPVAAGEFSFTARPAVL